LKWAPPKGGLRFDARPGGKDLLWKNHEAASISWPRRANPPNPQSKVFSPGRGDPPVARSARRILRKPVEASKERASPADALCTEGPCPRATTQASRKCQTRIVPRQSRGFTFRKLYPAARQQQTSKFAFDRKSPSSFSRRRSASFSVRNSDFPGRSHPGRRPEIFQPFPDS
jgi:hypothetical protein